MIKRVFVAGALAAGFALSTMPFSAHADDRPPTPEERKAIEDVLQQEGFSTWEEIEFDDGVWEVDDAVGADGTEFDLWLDPETFGVIGKRPDHVD